MVLVKKVKWINKDIQMADVILSDGVNYIECFCSNCNILEGHIFSDIIYGIFVENIIISYKMEYVIDIKNGGYRISGKLVDIKNSILQVGEFKIDLSDGHIPKDIKQNDWIEADVLRIDIY